MQALAGAGVLIATALVFAYLVRLGRRSAPPSWIRSDTIATGLSLLLTGSFAFGALHLVAGIAVVDPALRVVLLAVALGGLGAWALHRRTRRARPAASARSVAMADWTMPGVAEAPGTPANDDPAPGTSRHAA